MQRADIAMEHVIARMFVHQAVDETVMLYRLLVNLGPAGIVSVNLLRALQASQMAKVYPPQIGRRGHYDRKDWSLDNLCIVLGLNAKALGVVWGWGEDPERQAHRWVLYVELPTGQVSFHTAARGDGPDYPGRWDGQRGESSKRVIRYAASLLAPAAPSAVPAERALELA